MADNLTIARPYAKALFADAKTDSRLSEWSNVLNALSHLAKNPKMQHLIFNPNLSEKELVTLFYELTLELVGKLPEQVQQNLKNFLNLLSQNKRLAVLPEITILYQRLLATYEGIMKVEIISAKQLDEPEKKHLEKVLAKRFNSNIVSKFKIDESLIGGMLIRTDTWVWDGTVRDKLNRLAENLKAL